MKRVYVKPEMKGEAFVANEYVAACYYDIFCRGYNDSDVNDGYIVRNKDVHTHTGLVETVKGEPSFSSKSIKCSPLGMGIIGNWNEKVDSYGSHWRVEAVPHEIPGHPNASI